MSFARYQFTVTDDEGNIIPAASVEVRTEATGARLAVLYSDREGTTPIGNPMAADSEGFAAFHVVGGAYRITATSGAFSRVWRYVGIGLAAETDALTTGVSYMFDPLTADADPGSGSLRLNNATLASVTSVYIDNVNFDGGTMSTWLNTFDDGGSSSDRGNLLITARGGAAFLLARVTGSVVDGTGYRKLTVTVLASAGAFAADELLSLSFAGRGVDSVATSGTFETDAIVAAASSTTVKTTTASYSGDLDSLAGSADKFSVRRVATGVTNEPSGATENGSHVITHVWDTNAARQIYLEQASTRMWTRQKSSGSWGAWVRLITDADAASVADVRAATAATASDAQLLTAPLIESASAFVALTDAATVALDWDAGVNFTLTLAGNRALGTPTNAQPGTWRTIKVNGNDGTDRSLSFSGYRGGQATLTDIDNAKEYLLTLFAITSTVVILKATQALP